jgi:hypothetical protein
MGDENTIRDAADAVKGIVEAVPVYQDTIQPAAKELGIALQTVTKALHIVVSPAAALTFGYEKLQDYLNNKLNEKLKDLPPERIQPPDLNTAVKAIEGLALTEEEELRELFTNLIASSMDQHTSGTLHPSFADIIKQLSADEALIIRTISRRDVYFEFCSLPVISAYPSWANKDRNIGVHRASDLAEDAKCAYPDRLQIYLDNLERLGLISFRFISARHGDDEGFLFQRLRDQQTIVNFIEEHRLTDSNVIYEYEDLTITALGSAFIRTCSPYCEAEPYRTGNEREPRW